MKRRDDLEVLIVGAGPTGLSMAQLLARQGIRVRAISRHRGTAHTPRGHITNARTMEVLRDMGLESRARELAMPQALMRHSQWATQLADGEVLASLDSWGAGPERLPEYQRASPCAPCNLHQHRLEPLLLDAAQGAGARVDFEQEFLSLSQDEEGVRAELRDLRSGEVYELRARYLVAADGANSRVATQLGVSMDDELVLGTAISCWIEADLSRWVADRPGALYWLSALHAERGVQCATLVNVEPWHQWMMAFGVPPDQIEAELQPDALMARARAVIGDASAPIAIRDVSRWTVRRAVASRMRVGRVFLAGDAAHRHPPTNGLGTNTSIQDSFNLAWKLALVLRGQAADSLLDSYEAERLPVARAVVHRAMESSFEMHAMFEAIGLYPGLPSEAAATTLAGLKASSPEGEARRARLQQALALQNYQLNALGIEMGQWYERGAVVGAGPRPAGDADPILHYQPHAVAGAPLPHAWLQRGGQRCSTLDLVGHGRWVLLCGAEAGPWRQAAQRLFEDRGLGLKVISIGPDAEVQDVEGNWLTLAQAGPSTAWLVRPDRHIAWRSDSADQAFEQLDQVMNQLLGPQQ